MEQSLTKSEILYLLAVETIGETGKIAEKLRVAKSSVSRALDNLYGKHLVVRKAGGAELSSKGAELAVLYRVCIEHIEKALLEREFQERGLLDIACGIAASFGTEIEVLYRKIKEDNLCL